MKMLAFCLYDTKTGVYHVPFFFPHPALAIRAIGDLAGDQSTHVGRHPMDFALFHIGDFDDQTGVLSASTPVSLGTAHAIAMASQGTQTELKL